MRGTNRGAALLMAMLTAAIVASLAATAIWRYSNMVAVESAQRQRAQMAWLLQGALDWARLILIEDAKANKREAADHLDEPWAMPLKEARLSTFLAAQQEAAADGVTDQAFLSGAIRDGQSRFNLTNLQRDQGLSEKDVDIFMALCDRVGVNTTPWLDAFERYRADRQLGAPTFRWVIQRLEDWHWWGVPLESIRAMAEFVDVLPQRTPINVNTASAVVLEAAWPGLSPAQAQSIVAQRQVKPFTNLNDVRSVAPDLAFDTQQFSTTSQYFWVTGQLRLSSTTATESTLLKRDNLKVSVVRRERQSGFARPVDTPVFE